VLGERLGPLLWASLVLEIEIGADESLEEAHDAVEDVIHIFAVAKLCAQVQIRRQESVTPLSLSLFNHRGGGRPYLDGGMLLEHVDEELEQLAKL
jgi:hypothetical protein